jgi:hypothetical protein
LKAEKLQKTVTDPHQVRLDSHRTGRVRAERGGEVALGSRG